MDERGGCCIVRYGYGCGGGREYDMSKVDSRRVLRFRPIAPKPVNERSTAEKGDVYVKSGSGRGRRRKKSRCVKQRCNNNNPTNNKRKRSSKVAGEEKTVVTLPLLPESPEPKDSEKQRNSDTYSATWLSFEGFENNSNSTTSRGNKVGGMNMMMQQQQQPVRVMGQCVTVDCVTDTWVEGDGLGCTDEEKRMNLERDTCPGFVSDGVGRVVWTNGAYRNMVGQGHGDDDHEMMVWLVMKERAARAVGVMSNFTAAFTCRVRVQYHQYGGCESSTSSPKDWISLTLPCDVWRMESGGFAWRLDVKAALCLGRYGTKAV